MQKFSGLLIAFEGIDGSGKSTTLRAVEQQLTKADYSVVVTKEPGGTEFGKLARSVVQQPGHKLTAHAEFLLFAADRAEHRAKIVLPALSAGKIILCDRMADSSVAYQGYGRGLSIDMINTINSWVLEEVHPQLTCYFAIDCATARMRMKHRAQELSGFDQERESFFERVIAGYEQLYKDRTDVLRINACDSVEHIAQQIYSRIQMLIAHKETCHTIMSEKHL